MRFEVTQCFLVQASCTRPGLWYRYIQDGFYGGTTVSFSEITTGLSRHAKVFLKTGFSNLGKFLHELASKLLTFCKEIQRLQQRNSKPLRYKSMGRTQALTDELSDPTAVSRTISLFQVSCLYVEYRGMRSTGT